MPSPRAGRAKLVYVDAKILNAHDQALKKRAYVGFVVKGGSRRAKPVRVKESDDAEVLAVVFAIESLKGTLRRFTVVCDHQSVVSEANRESAKRPSRRLARLRRMLRENPGVKLRMVETNPAHGMLTEYVNGLKARRKDAGHA
jgi:hypothetical protein